MTYWIGCLSGTKEVSLVPITGKNKRLDYEYRLCRMKTLTRGHGKPSPYDKRP